MSGKPDTHGRMGGITKDARDKLLSGVKEMFAWLGPKAARMTVMEVFEKHYLAFASPSPVTRRRYYCELRRFERLADSPRLCDLNHETFRRFRERAMAEELSASSIEGSMTVVKAVTRFARDAGWIKSVPQFGKPIRIDAPIPNPATLEEIELLYRFADHASRPAKGKVAPADWWRCFLCLELWTGFRVSDVASRFAWEHVREDH
ncbi:MAG: hypothetical protein KF861_11085, partial [Planctomycetaceae bacterium]|nr:hypothetical protein [Planctomycetaceae bacterium]